MVFGETNILLDDIVVVVDDTLPMNMWPIGRIQGVYEEKDGKIRVVEVKTQTVFINDQLLKFDNY